MLHELLFILLGYSGDIFVPAPPNNPTTFAIPPDFSLLHPTEREFLIDLDNWDGFIHKLIISSIQHKISKTLREYQSDILDIEKRILNKEDEAGSGIIPISLIAANLSRWELLLPAIWKFIQLLESESEKYHGCRLFNLVMNQIKTGVLEYRKEMEKIMDGLHDVLYRQLTAWMVYGQRVDHYDEFFIVPFDQGAATSTTGWNRLFTIAADRVPDHIPYSVAESILFVGKAIATVNEIDRMPSTAAINRHDEDVLLTSSSVRAVTQTKKIPIPESMRKEHLGLLLKLHSSCLSQHQSSSPWISYPQILEDVVSQVRRSTSDWLFSQVLIGDHGIHRYLSSFRHIFLLSFGEWASNFIQECSAWGKRSMSPAINQNRKKPAPSTDGSMRPTNKAAVIFRQQELNALLIKSSLNTEAEDQLLGYSLLVEDGPTKEYPFSDILLRNLSIVLTFRLEWPVDLFINEARLITYSNLWTFLISIKKTQASLNNLWKTLRSNGHQEEALGTYSISNKGAQFSDDGDGYQERLVWRLRSIMLFWIDNFWNHLQAHVISFHYDQLIYTTTLDETTTTSSSIKRLSRQSKVKLDFEEIQKAHDVFLKNIQQGCLMTSEECIHVMHDILQTCTDFCELMEKMSEEGEWRKSKRRRIRKTAADIVDEWTRNDSTSWLNEVERIQERFTKCTETFFGLASFQPPDVKLNGKIDILLMQLDYNKWFSKPSY
ncbi:unnamed protein product [Rhizopus microsporus]